MLSFLSGLLFAIVEFIFAIYSHSQSALTDAVYDASELVFIALLLFLTPLFHKPVSEKHPYGYFQVESIFVIIKIVMMLSVTMGVSAEVLDSALSGGNIVNNAQVSIFQCCLGVASIIIFLIMKRLSVTMGVSAEVLDSALSGGNIVNNAQVSIFQCCLGVASIIIFLIMKRLNRNLSSPTIEAELLGWKLDIVYSMGVSIFQCCLGVASIIIFLIMKRLNRNLSSPTIEAELLGWKLDIVYSMGMALAFLVSLYLKKTPLGFISPYFDQSVQYGYGACFFSVFISEKNATWLHISIL